MYFFYYINLFFNVLSTKNVYFSKLLSVENCSHKLLLRSISTVCISKSLVTYARFNNLLMAK